MGDWKKWIEELALRISEDISNVGDEPLDEDETERLGRLLTLELDKRQGNLTEEEYWDGLLSIEFDRF